MCGRRLIGLLALLGAAAAFAPGTAAARPGAGYPETLTTAHFQIHYTGAITTPANPDRILQQVAGDLAGHAERAYELYVDTWGFPAPKDDGDGKVDIWVQKQTDGLDSVTTWEDPTPPSQVWISIDPSKADNPYAASVVVMQAVQAALWVPDDTWMTEATAAWAAYNATGFDNAAGSLAPPDLSLDCETDTCANQKAATHGHTRWGFFEYLGERYGPSIVKDVYTTGKTLNDPALTGRELLSKTLLAKGTSLPAVFNDFAAAHVRGGYTAAGLKGAAPEFYATIPVGLISSALPVKKVPVSHLAARYVKFARDTSNIGPCYQASLSVTVALPAGSQSKPSFYDTSGTTPAGFLSVNGTTASLTVPWSTCSSGGDLYVAIPNPSETADGQNFTVSGTLTVTSLSATPPSAPPPPAYGGPSTPAPTTGVAPSILVHGSELVKVPAATRLVRLLVFASGPGQLRATVGDVVLGTVALRAGNNDVRLVLPAATIKSIRAVKAVRATDANVLTLTSLSPEGAAGQSVTRKLTVVAPPVKASKPKKTTKKTASRR